MTLIQHSIFRALCAIAVGALLVSYPDKVVTWITITIGVLFFLSGIVATVMAYVKHSSVQRLRKEAEEKAQMTDGEHSDASDIPQGQTGCGLSMVVSCGCILLGVVLALMPTQFANYLMYMLSAFLILGAIQQYFVLGLAHKEDSVGLVWWVMPSLLLIAGIFIMINPQQVIKIPALFIGCCMLVYGVVEVLNGIKSYRCHKAAAKRIANDGKPDFSKAEVVEYEEVPQETQP